jgi:two-component system, chemotaxis family, chemotaxis protein CheY
MSPDNSKSSGKLKILIVDDDLISRKYLHGILRKFGSCDIAVNGKEALEFFKIAIKNKDLYSIVFLDIMMPEMDGDETLRLIRELEEKADIDTGQGAKVAMISALNDKKNVLASFSGGCEYYLVKPVHHHKIEEIVTEIEISKN